MAAARRHGWYVTGQVTGPVSWADLCTALPPVDGRFLVLGVVGEVRAA